MTTIVDRETTDLPPVTDLPATVGGIHSGVYLVRVGPHYYFGSSSDLARRHRNHEWAVLTGRHTNRYMQRAWEKYGSLTFQVVEMCPIGMLVEREQHYLDLFFGLEGCMNLSPSAHNNTGIKWTPQTIARMKASALLRPPRDRELIERIAIKNRGKVRTDAFKARVSEFHAGRTKSETERERMAVASLKRIPSEYMEWFAEHGRMPRRNSADGLEARVNAWLSAQRASVRSGVRTDWLDENLPGWREWSQRDEDWLLRAQQAGEAVQMFLVEADDSDALNAAVQWLQKQRRRGHRLDYLDETIPSWRLVASFADRKWLRDAIAVRDRLVTLHQAAKWCAKQRKGSTPRRAWLDQHVPNWADITTTLTDDWLAIAEACRCWVALHNGRHPRQQAHTSEERRVGIWLTNQRMTADSERSQWLDVNMPGWTISNNAHSHVGRRAAR